MALLTKLIFYSEGNTTLFFVIKNKDDKPLLFYRLHGKGLCGGRGNRHKEDRTHTIEDKWQDTAKGGIETAKFCPTNALSRLHKKKQL